MKKTLMLAIAVLMLGWTCVSYAGPPSASFEWDPPATRIANDDCAQRGDALTPEEIALLQYTLSYKVKGSADPWTNVETSAPTAVVSNLLYETTYEASVGAHFEGKLIVCSTDLIEWTTPDAPAPGACSNLRKVLP